jgi:hypothetical protein
MPDRALGRRNKSCAVPKVEQVNKRPKLGRCKIHPPQRDAMACTGGGQSLAIELQLAYMHMRRSFLQIENKDRRDPSQLATRSSGRAARSSIIGIDALSLLLAQLSCYSR